MRYFSGGVYRNGDEMRRNRPHDPQNQNWCMLTIVTQTLGLEHQYELLQLLRACCVRAFACMQWQGDALHGP